MSWSGIHDGCPLHGNATDQSKADSVGGCLCEKLRNIGYEAKHEADRREYAQATPRARRYDICTKAINMTCLSIELERLERIGIPKSVTNRWNKQALELLQEILAHSDTMVENE